MRIHEEIRIMWRELTGKQKGVLVVLGTLIVSLMISGWIDSWISWREIRVARNDAIEAQREKHEALEQAAKIAANIKVREEALGKVEAKRDEKQKQVDAAAAAVGSARAEYDRAVRERRVDTPSTDELCSELAALGYPCRR